MSDFRIKKNTLGRSYSFFARLVPRRIYKGELSADPLVSSEKNSAGNFQFFLNYFLG